MRQGGADGTGQRAGQMGLNHRIIGFLGAQCRVKAQRCGEQMDRGLGRRLAHLGHGFCHPVKPRGQIGERPGPVQPGFQRQPGEHAIQIPVKPPFDISGPSGHGAGKGQHQHRHHPAPASRAAIRHPHSLTLGQRQTAGQKGGHRRKIRPRPLSPGDEIAQGGQRHGPAVEQQRLRPGGPFLHINRAIGPRLLIEDKPQAIARRGHCRGQRPTAQKRVTKPVQPLCRTAEQKRLIGIPHCLQLRRHCQHRLCRAVIKCPVNRRSAAARRQNRAAIARPLAPIAHCDANCPAAAQACRVSAPTSKCIESSRL